MDSVLLSRIFFGVTIGFHFLFAPLTIGLSWLIVGLMNRYRRSGSVEDANHARFWVHILALTFAVGVATGITMEFQFGTNWAQYSRYVGDIFGAPLAIEVIFTFFLESTFLAALLFGWNRLSPRAHWVAALMVAVGATLSAFWILVANSWMQTPAGFTFRHGRAEMTDFLQVVFNASMLPRFAHTVDAALLTGALFMLGISAWLLLRKPDYAPARYTLSLALVVGFITAVLQLLTGHVHAVQLEDTQPAKLAAAEGLFHTQTHAPFTIFGIPDPANARLRYAVRIPGGLSFLTDFNTAARVKGLDYFPRKYWPPVFWVFVPFHLMVLLGLYFIAMTALGLLLAWRRVLFGSRWFLWLAAFTIPLPFLANELGWLVTEMGRQPWIVYWKMLTSDAVSTNVPAGHVVFSLIAFSAIYSLLFIFWLMMVRREVRHGLNAPPPGPAEEIAA